MPDTMTLTMRVPAEIGEQLRFVAEATDRSKAYCCVARPATWHVALSVAQKPSPQPIPRSVPARPKESWERNESVRSHVGCTPGALPLDPEVCQAWLRCPTRASARWPGVRVHERGP
jgi:hypothetical protein